MKSTLRRNSLSQWGIHLLFAYILIAAFGTVIFSVLYRITSWSIVLVAAGLKDILLLWLLILLSMVMVVNVSIDNGKLYINKQDVHIYALTILFFVIFVMSCIRSQASFNTIVVIFRRYFLPLCVIIFYMNVRIDKDRLDQFVNKVCIILTVFGVVEYLMPDSFWDNIICLPNYWMSSGDRWARSSVSNTGRFYTFDLYSIFGHTIRRMVSGFAEPTNFSSFMISAYIILNKKRYRFTRFLCLVCCMLAVSKAALVGLLFIYPFLFIYNRFSKHHNYHVLFLIMFIILFLVSFVFYMFGYNRGAFSHIYGFYTGVMAIIRGNVFGYGIGNVGNFADKRVAYVGGESGIGAMLGQCGIGALVYIAIFYFIIKILEKRLEDNFVYIALVFVWMVICIFSESGFGASGNILFWVYGAIGIFETISDNYLSKAIKG